MAPSNIRSTSAIAFVGLLAALFASEAAYATSSVFERGGEVPRYRLEPGRILTYDTSAASERDGQSTTHESVFEIHVLTENEDGSFRLLLRKHSGEGEDAKLAWVDVFPNGRMLRNLTTYATLDASMFFAKLPQHPEDLAWGWTREDPGTGKATRYRGKPTEQGLTIEAVESAPTDGIYSRQATHEARFDASPKKRVLVTIEASSTTGWPETTITRWHAELRHVRWRSSEKARRLADETEHYFATIRAYEDAVANATANLSEAHAILADAEVLLSQAIRRTANPWFLEPLRKRLDFHQRTMRIALETAERRAAILDSEAPMFEAADFRGNRHELSDYRGKVVVLDFWFRRCGWCVRAMPQIQRLARTFEGQPVVVLGMNVDADRADAVHTIDAMGLDYPNLAAIGIPETYGIRGYPAVVLIDRDGIVRHLHTGFSPTLHDDLADRIQTLLGDESRD